ncbi:MAG: CPBP family intramembrane metalloprotease [Thermoleophilia bacterium]|nr:CPBP family intramembrane metalloprotease [Thermoleophilia bacterium]
MILAGHSTDDPPASPVRGRGRTPSPPRSGPAAPRWWPYFALAFAVSWTGWIAAALTGASWTSMPTVLLFAVGGAGPLVATLVLTRTSLTRDERGRFWRRVVDPRAIPAAWFVAILVLGAGPALAAVLLRHAWDGGDAPSLVLPSLPAFAGILAFNLVAAFAEEPGWRGYALDRLRALVSGRVAALAVGAFWLLWHVPLYFVEGTFQEQNGFLSLAFGVYSLALLPSAVIFGWAVVRTSGSILAAVLLHLVENVSGEILELDPGTQVIRVVLLAIIATVVWWRWRPEAEPRGARP